MAMPVTQQVCLVKLHMQNVHVDKLMIMIIGKVVQLLESSSA